MAAVLDESDLLTLGVSAQDARVALAAKLFESGAISRIQACRFLGVDRIDLTMLFGKLGVDVARYSAEELDQDLATLRDLETHAS